MCQDAFVKDAACESQIEILSVGISTITLETGAWLLLICSFFLLGGLHLLLEPSSLELGLLPPLAWLPMGVPEVLPRTEVTNSSTQEPQPCLFSSSPWPVCCDLSDSTSWLTELTLFKMSESSNPEITGKQAGLSLLRTRVGQTRPRTSCWQPSGWW